MTRVLVVGGGIAGTAVALAVAKAGFDVSVYEAHPDSGADIGAFLTLADNGMRALAQIDAAEAVAGRGFPLTAMSVLDHTGAEIASVPLGGHDHPLTNYRCLRRAELGDVLRSEVQRRSIPIRHGARLASLTEDGHGVTLRFTDGSTATGDIAVGADGLNSTTRRLVDPAAAGPRYAGQHVWYGYTTAARPPTAPERITMIRGSASAFGYCVSPAGETFWFARTSAPEPLSAEEIGASTDRLLPLLQPDATPAHDIVAATGDQLMVTDASDLTPGIRWHTAATVLVGDAAHAASPATGQGASMALEDAVVLAKALRDVPGDALRSYDRLRRPRVERNIMASAAATAGRPAGNDRRQSHVDDELPGLLDWRTQITA
jgi:2-polyprenyl-6-methoxyphenol hydroxylase-like FAD-dependent oxidoreductase